MGFGDGTPSNPPWHGRALWGSKDRNVSDSWWKELGHVVPPFLKNQRNQFGTIKEKDSVWYDAPVKDGESLAGMFGEDTKYNFDRSKKNHQPGDLHEFRNKVMKESVQYKQIAERHQISDEHPGIPVSPNLKALSHLEPYIIGKGGPFYNSYSHIGPRFFDKPINEGCLEKGFCLVKYAAMATGVVTGLQLKAFPQPTFEDWNAKMMLRTYMRNLPLPCTMSFVYGVGLCSSASIRNADDCYNYIVASIFSGAVLSTVKSSFAMGVAFTIGTSLLGFYYQLARSSNSGFGRSTSQEPGGYPLASGPVAWKYYEGSRVQIPERTHY